MPAETPPADPQQRLLSPRERVADDAYLALLNAADDFADGDLIVGNLYTLHRAVTAVWDKELEQLRTERDALKAVIEQVEADAVEQQQKTGTTRDPWQLGVYAQASRTRCILRDALDAPSGAESPTGSTTPANPHPHATQTTTGPQEASQ